MLELGETETLTEVARKLPTVEDVGTWWGSAMGITICTERGGGPSPPPSEHRKSLSTTGGFATRQNRDLSRPSYSKRFGAPNAPRLIPCS